MNALLLRKIAAIRTAALDEKNIEKEKLQTQRENAK